MGNADKKVILDVREKRIQDENQNELAVELVYQPGATRSEGRPYNG